MLAKTEILDLFTQHQDELAAAYFLCYGERTGEIKWAEVLEAFSREDDEKVVRSVSYLFNEMPKGIPIPSSAVLISEHQLDNDYCAKPAVPTHRRDPLVNVFTDNVLPGEQREVGVDDFSLDELFTAQ